MSINSVVQLKLSVFSGFFRVLFIHSRTQSDSELVSEGLWLAAAAAFAALLIRSVCSQLSLRAVNALLWAPGAWQLPPSPYG